MWRKVATYLPLIPLVILLILAGKTFAGVGTFKPEILTAGATEAAPSAVSLMLFVIANIVGFFATAGAAGADIASSNRDRRDVQLGGLVGVAGSTIFTGCLALLIVAGAYGSGLMGDKPGTIDPTKLMNTIMGEQWTKIFWLLAGDCCVPAGLLQFADCREQFQEHVAESQSVHLMRSWHGGVCGPRAVRQCR